MFSFGGNWFMDQISVTDVSQGQTYVWACREWFDKAKGCRKEWELSKQLAGAAQPLELTEGIVRVAQAPGQEASGREEAVPETKWKLGVHTAKVTLSRRCSPHPHEKHLSDPSCGVLPHEHSAWHPCERAFLCMLMLLRDPSYVKAHAHVPAGILRRH